MSGYLGFEPSNLANGFVFVSYNNEDAVFAGHCHANNTSVLWEGIRWTYGLKTGQYDYHTAGQLGGTLVTLWDGDFSVAHVPSLTAMTEAPNPPRH